MSTVEVKGVKNLTKLIDSLSNGNYSFHVCVDDYQAQKPEDERCYMIEIADRRDGERFEVKEDFE